MIVPFVRAAVLVLLAFLSPAAVVLADGRPAGAILGDFDAIVVPPIPPKTDREAIKGIMEARTKAMARQAELALELQKAHPDDPRVPELLMVRFPILLSKPGKTGETLAEIDAALPTIKDPKIARDLMHLKLIALLASTKLTGQASPLVDEFIRQDPMDPRNPELLNRLGWSSSDLAVQAETFRRLIAQYPDSVPSKIVTKRLELLDRIGKPFELEFVDAIKGSTVSIKGLKGKVVVIDFWATWCGPCVAEMLRLKKLHAEFKDQGVEFIGVSLDFPKEEGGLDKLKAFVAQNEIPWPHYYQGNGWESTFSRSMNIHSIPQLFLVDADGRLANIDARRDLERLIPEYLEKAKAASNTR